MTNVFLRLIGLKQLADLRKPENLNKLTKRLHTDLTLALQQETRKFEKKFATNIDLPLDNDNKKLKDDYKNVVKKVLQKYCQEANLTVNFEINGIEDSIENFSTYNKEGSPVDIIKKYRSIFEITDQIAEKVCNSINISKIRQYSIDKTSKTNKIRNVGRNLSSIAEDLDIASLQIVYLTGVFLSACKSLISSTGENLAVIVSAVPESIVSAFATSLALGSLPLKYAFVMSGKLKEYVLDNDISAESRKFIDESLTEVIVKEFSEVAKSFTNYAEKHISLEKRTDQQLTP